MPSSRVKRLSSIQCSDSSKELNDVFKIAEQSKIIDQIRQVEKIESRSSSRTSSRLRLIKLEPIKIEPTAHKKIRLKPLKRFKVKKIKSTAVANTVALESSFPNITQVSPVPNQTDDFNDNTENQISNESSTKSEDLLEDNPSLQETKNQDSFDEKPFEDPKGFKKYAEQLPVSEFYFILFKKLILSV